ncbi:MAG: hypothetical protein WCK89_05935 [bacterium]
MKTTIELQDTLYRRVKSKSSIDGKSVRAVTQRLYELWLAGAVSLDDGAATEPDGKSAWAEKWVRETEELSNQIGEKAADKRLGRDILKDDRR